MADSCRIFNKTLNVKLNFISQNSTFQTNISKWIKFRNCKSISLNEILLHRRSVTDPRVIVYRLMNCTRQKRNAPLRTFQLSARSQVMGQFSLYQCKGMSGTVASHVFCNLASKLCLRKSVMYKVGVKL